MVKTNTLFKKLFAVVLSCLLMFSSVFTANAAVKPDDTYVISPGDGLNESQARRTANRFTDERYWFLKLNKASSGTGCDAWGYIRNS